MLSCGLTPFSYSGTTRHNRHRRQQQQLKQAARDTAEIQRLRCFIHYAVTMNNRWLIDMQYITRYTHARAGKLRTERTCTCLRAGSHAELIFVRAQLSFHIWIHRNAQKGETQRCGERGRSKARQREKTDVKYVRNPNMSYKSYITQMVQKASFIRSPDGESSQDVQWF